ncbi:MAG TPA: hypothetical protein VJY62_16500 [Bacteroidia bacterium]|nr:hypothetical protein [Bacteroidia bacterium]
MKNNLLPGDKPENGKKMVFEIPVEGALGLLALGADGVKAWKEKKKLVKQQEPEKEKQTPSENKPG